MGKLARHEAYNVGLRLEKSLKPALTAANAESVIIRVKGTPDMAPFNAAFPARLLGP
jgi:hypothetical protein